MLNLLHLLWLQRPTLEEPIGMFRNIVDRLRESGDGGVGFQKRQCETELWYLLRFEPIGSLKLIINDH